MLQLETQIHHHNQHSLLQGMASNISSGRVAPRLSGASRRFTSSKWFGVTLRTPSSIVCAHARGAEQRVLLPLLTCIMISWKHFIWQRNHNQIHYDGNNQNVRRTLKAILYDTLGIRRNRQLKTIEIKAAHHAFIKTGPDLTERLQHNAPNRGRATATFEFAFTTTYRLPGFDSTT